MARSMIGSRSFTVTALSELLARIIGERTPVSFANLVMHLTPEKVTTT